ncbi:MAG: hypothetical protein EB163_04905 [Nitrososphaeria archaeon]|nr:hypothetical protein [Nitrososphaeria archaeon]NDB51015.1 hypothetical protein [Nitrosopumilaceae archaeon]NDB63919.1 hypothetical protein [Nitrosopumilaceae archaeon]NDB90480.1 hypothetical protein [Nitrososphaerota archaeon]NDF35005.1 hypothetical protein [Nitrosopumilaceae archaeon]
MDLEKFQDDVYTITNKLGKSLDENDIPKLNFVRQRLIELYQQNLVKINHSVLELICAANLVSKGFSVDVEKPLTGSLVCDLYGKKDGKTAIIEIETGFTPPEHALDTIDYYTSRIVSKIARYSKYCDSFSLATPVIGMMPINKIFLNPPSQRSPVEIKKIKSHCDIHYKNPPIEYEDILNAKLDSVYLINIDKGFAKEVNPASYYSLTSSILEKSEIDL